MKDVNKTTVHKSNDQSNTLRTVIPVHIIAQMELHDKDSITWKLHKEVNGKWIYTLRKSDA